MSLLNRNQHQERIVLVGAGPLGMNVAHIIEQTGFYRIAGFIDAAPGTIAGYPVLGDDSVLADLHNQGINYAFVSIGNSAKRQHLSMRLMELGYTVPTLIHPAADIGLCANIGKGSIIFHNAFVGPYATLGDFCIIESGAFIGHHAVIGDGVLLSARTIVGNQSKIGNGVIMRLGSQCGDKSVIEPQTVIDAFKIVDQNR